MSLTPADHALLLTDPALRWCLDADKPGYSDRGHKWLARTLAFQADELGDWLSDGADATRAVGWLSEVGAAPEDADTDTDVEADDVEGVDAAANGADNADDDALTEEEARLDALLAELTEIAGDDAVERFFAYAEAVDGLQPDVACHALSSVAAATPDAVAPLIAQALAEVAAAPHSTGLFAETADADLAVALEAAGGEAGGQVFTADVVVRSFWWPSP